MTEDLTLKKFNLNWKISIQESVLVWNNMLQILKISNYDSREKLKKWKKMKKKNLVFLKISKHLIIVLKNSKNTISKNKNYKYLVNKINKIKITKKIEIFTIILQINRAVLIKKIYQFKIHLILCPKQSIRKYNNKMYFLWKNIKLEVYQILTMYKILVIQKYLKILKIIINKNKKNIN